MSAVAGVTCREAVSRLWEYLDGQLAGPDAAAIREHLETCARCFPHTEFQRAYRDFMAQGGQASLPPEVRRRVFQALLDEMGSGDGDAGGASAEPGSLRALLDRMRTGD
jgi:mycothiol system anti-sigma-R factor